LVLGPEYQLEPIRTTDVELDLYPQNEIEAKHETRQINMQG